MSFRDDPIINSPFEVPLWHYELDEADQPTGKKLPGRRESRQVVPVPAARRRGPRQRELELFDAVRRRAAAEAPRVQDTARGLAALDVLSALAHASP